MPKLACDRRRCRSHAPGLMQRAWATGKAGDMLGTPIGLTFFAAALLAAGLAGIAACWAAWPRSSNTSPLAALLSLVWSCTYIVSALLTWRRSRLAAPAFLAAMGLLLP